VTIGYYFLMVENGTSCPVIAMHLVTKPSIKKQREMIDEDMVIVESSREIGYGEKTPL